MTRTKTNPPGLGLDALRQLLLEANSAHSTEQQVDALIARLRQLMSVDVCSLYQQDQSQALHLVANEGLNPASPGHVVLNAGEGLAGLVAATKLPLNLADATQHPNFVHVADLGEEAMHAYLGLPIIHLDRVLGVLVLQDRSARSFSAEEESFLIAATALLANGLSQNMLSRYHDARNHRYLGMSGAPHQAIGQILLTTDARTMQWRDPPDHRGIETEAQLLDQAFSLTREELIQAAAQTNHLAEEVTSIFSVYRQLLDDGLKPAAQAKVRDGLSAFVSIRNTVDELLVGFQSLEDDYLRARGDDIRHLGEMLHRHLMNVESEPLPTSSAVLVGSLIGVADIARFAPQQLTGIVSFTGSALSHTAVLAKALGIPAVLGTGPIDHIRNGDKIIVDGDRGEVIVNPDARTLRAYRASIEAERALQDRWLADKNLPGLTLDQQSIGLFANTGLLSDTSPGLVYGADGVGLFRSEFLFIAHSAFPAEETQRRVYRELLENYHPRPVTIRTLDIGSDKQLPYLPIDEENPALGWRGIRFCLDNKAVIATQLRAMLAANAGLGNLQILLPMISQLHEITFIVEIVDALLAELQDQGLDLKRPQLGIMVEVPAVIPLLAVLAPHLDFVSIGTNDLTQYALAIDRGNQRVAGYYDALHPGVLHMINFAIAQCRRLDLPLSVCGEMAADPLSAIVLLGFGARNFSMSATAIPRLRALVRSIKASDAEVIAEAALHMESAAAVRTMVQQRAARHGLTAFLTR